ncbi:Nicotinate phosphoribosyltransferase pncB2 [Paenibacillus sp. P1XP2]|nr:Nicotinate phosphoribosyltransferase pncB2 [Paenibacillus sp. P1XP2]
MTDQTVGTPEALYPDDSLALHTDKYQINMTQVYWQDGIHDRKAVFEVYFRKIPFQNGYAVFAGLERLVRYLQDFRFSDSDLAFLKEDGYPDEYLDYLRTLRFTGTVRSMREGELVFANEPMLRIEAPLAEAQLIETAVLNIVNFQTLIATKASRIKQVVGDETTMEFGTRRAQELDAAIWGTRAAFLAGFDATSNVRAGKLFDIPTAARMPMRWSRRTATSTPPSANMPSAIPTACFWWTRTIRCAPGSRRRSRLRRNSAIG